MTNIIQFIPTKADGYHFKRLRQQLYL